MGSNLLTLPLNCREQGAQHAKGARLHNLKLVGANRLAASAARCQNRIGQYRRTGGLPVGSGDVEGMNAQSPTSFLSRRGGLPGRRDEYCRCQTTTGFESSLALQAMPWFKNCGDWGARKGAKDVKHASIGATNDSLLAGLRALRYPVYNG